MELLEHTGNDPRQLCLEVTEDAVADYNADIQRRMKRTVWTTGGCASWYLDSHGNNTTLWPRTTFAFRGQTARFDIDAYRVEARTGAQQEVMA